MDKINVNAIDASMATEGATDYLLGVDASGEVKKTNIAALDTYSRAEIDAKNAEDKQYADLQVSALIGGATPENLNTLSELAAALEKEGDAIVAINNELGTKYSPSNKPTPADIGALPVGHVPLYVGAADKRQVIPSQVGGNRIEPLFVSNLTLGIGDPNSYSDLVVMNTYTDVSGGFMNALAFDKTSKAIYHFQSDMNGTEWGVASVVYTSANPPTLAGMKALGYAHFATDAATLRNSSGFTYAVDAPFAGPIIDFGNEGTAYSMQINAEYGSGSRAAFRVHNGDRNAWGSWFEFYHQGNKPTPAELGSLPINEPVATGRMVADNYRTAGGGTLYNQGGVRTWITSKSTDGPHKGIGVSETDGALYWDGSVERTIWHNGNAPETATRWPSAAEVGALPLSGGNINGPFAATGVIRSDRMVRGFGTGNTYDLAGLETASTIAEPSISFHKEGAYAGTLRLISNAWWGFYNQDNSQYGSLTVTHLEAGSNLTAGSGISINQTDGTGKGLSLYGGVINDPDYGMMFAQIPTFGGHGSVNGDWATYFNLVGAGNRGWIFRHKGAKNAASISCDGNIHAASLDVSNVRTGDLTSTSWVRTEGDGGWYSATHGGGLHMLDATWIRTYGTKKFYVSNTEHDSIQTSGGIAASGNLQCHAIAAAGRITTSEGFSGNGGGLTNVPFGQVNATEHLLFNDPAGLNGGNFVLSQPFYHYKALVFYTSDDSARYMYSMTKTVEEINRLQSFSKPYGIMADSSYFWNGSFAADGRTFITAAEAGRIWQVIGLT